VVLVPRWVHRRMLSELDRKTYNRRRLTTVEHVKGLEQPPLVWSDRPTTDKQIVVSLLGILGRVSSVE
jgi:hypothetical protein